MFESLTIPEAKAIVWLKRLFTFVIVALLAIGVVSSYRAYVQVRSLELSAPGLLSEGSVAKTSVVSSGRPQWMRLPPPTVRELEVMVQ